MKETIDAFEKVGDETVEAKEAMRALAEIIDTRKTKHPGSKVPVKLRVERRRKANKRAAASRKVNR